jgi:hypothetical protein
VPASTIFGEIKDFLDRNLTDMLIVDVEDYVQPKDLKQALIDAGLFDRVWTPKHPGEWPSLYDMVVPKNSKSEDNPRRLIVMNEKHKSPYKWLLNTYAVSEETPFSFKSAAKFNCNPKRGGTDKNFLIVNHWVDAGGLPDPVETAKTNSRATLVKRFEQCVAVRNKIPNVFAVNFTTSGDMFKTVNEFNAAIAKQSHVTPAINLTIDSIRQTATTKSQVRSVERLRRLPRVSDRFARSLLGKFADTLKPPAALTKIVPQEAIDAALSPPTTTTTQPPSTP